MHRRRKHGLSRGEDTDGRWKRGGKEQRREVGRSGITSALRVRRCSRVEDAPAARARGREATAGSVQGGSSRIYKWYTIVCGCEQVE